LIVGCGDWFGATVHVRHERCTSRGDDVCVLVVAEREPV